MSLLRPTAVLPWGLRTAIICPKLPTGTGEKFPETIFQRCATVAEVWEAAGKIQQWEKELVTGLLRAQVRVMGFPYLPVFGWWREICKNNQNTVTSENLEIYLTLLIVSGRILTACRYLTSQTFKSCLTPPEPLLMALLTASSAKKQHTAHVVSTIYKHLQYSGRLWGCSERFLLKVFQHHRGKHLYHDQLAVLVKKRPRSVGLLQMSGNKHVNSLKVQRRFFMNKAGNRLLAVFDSVHVDLKSCFNALDTYHAFRVNSCEDDTSANVYYQQKASLAHVLIRNLPPDNNRSRVLKRLAMTSDAGAPSLIRDFTEPGLLWYTHRDYAIVTLSSGNAAQRFIARVDGTSPYGNRNKNLKLALARAKVNHVVERFGRKKTRSQEKPKGVKWEKI